VGKSGFFREHGLTKRPEFTRCYDAGSRRFSSGFVLFACRRDDPGQNWRLGMAVTRKTGSAVWRNRVRRLVRECFRLEREQVPDGYDYVVVPKRTLDPRGLSLHSVRGELLPLLRTFSRKDRTEAGRIRG
jgi:ribonuclease P protein component